MTTRVLMLPHPVQFRKEESGIKRVVEAYAKYLPDFGYQLVHPDDKNYDLKVTHAGLAGGDTDCAMLHGLYWSEDYKAPAWEFAANRNIVDAIRRARRITVPTRWVSEVFQRDMRIQPDIIPHGVDWDDWQHTEPNYGYVLWNKNRDMDVCDPTPMARLAQTMPNVKFLSTFVPKWMEYPPSNVDVIGLKHHATMKKIVQRAGVYLSTTKETFGIGILEALAAGIPVLGFDWGGNRELVQHGVNGYLAQSQDDLTKGLEWVLKHRKTLSANARELAKSWDWPSAVEKVAHVYGLAMQPIAHDVSVVIPCYNYASKLPRAVKSALAQTLCPKQIIIVDDGSTDNTAEVAKGLMAEYPNVGYVHQSNSGVAAARNKGVSIATATYVVCMDADDAMEPRFLEACVDALKADPSAGIAYTKIREVHPNGTEKISAWPEASDFDAQIRPRNAGNYRGSNQVPTCAVFRKELWERSAGYRSKFAPLGAGAEDAEFWTQIGAMGYRAVLASSEPLFIYSLGSGMISGGSEKWELREPMWLDDFPWVKDGRHPFASQATPKNKISHPVRQYDQPDISIIIPVGRAHREVLSRALDSVEAQSFRSWEVIVVFDDAGDMDGHSGHWGIPHYPYVRALYAGLSIGAGAARNMGVQHARGDYLVFLDADDELHQDFLTETMRAWKEYPNSIVYTDYLRKFKAGEKELSSFGGNLLSYERGVATIRSRSADYDWKLAQDPVGKKVYHWCMVTTLIPKAYHVPFDENMQTYEDVLYHWILARKGIPYVRVEKPLITYHMDTSTRRVLADKNDLGKDMLAYAVSKLKEVQKVACKTCPGQRAKQPINVIKEMTAMAQRVNADPLENDDNYLLVHYNSPQRGKHAVRGAVSRINYGYRAGGDRFYVHKDDVQAHSTLFLVVDPDPSPPQVEPEVLPEPAVLGAVVPSDEQEEATDELEPVELEQDEVVVEEVLPEPETEPAVDAGRELFKDMDVDLLPGVNGTLAKALKKDGITKASQVLAQLGVEGLVTLYNVGQEKAEILIAGIKEYQDK